VSLTRAVLTTTLTVVAVALLLYLVYLLRTPLSWLVVATFLAVALAGPVGFFSRYMKRGLAIALTYLLLLLVPVGMGALLIPPIVSEITDLIRQLPQYARDVTEYVQGNERLRDLNEDYGITSRIEEQARELPNRAGDAANLLGDLGLGIVNSTFAALTILIMSVFLVANGRRWVTGLLALQRPGRAELLGRSLDRMADATGAYVAGAVLQAIVAGVTTYIVLTILGVPFAPALAVLTALFDLIPMVGATIGAVLVGIVTLFSDFPTDTAVWTLWAFAYQQIENNVIQPRIQNRAVGVHPFGIIVAVLFGGTLFGVAGAILAVPVAASIQIAIRDWWAIRHRDVGAVSVASAAAGAAGGTVAPPPRGEPPPPAEPPPPEP